MPAPELPEAEQPEVDEPEMDTSLPPAAETEPDSEATSDEDVTPVEAERDERESEPSQEPAESDMPAPTPDMMSAGIPGYAETIDAALDATSFAETVESASEPPASSEAGPADEVMLPAPRPQLSIVAAGLLLIALGVMLIWPALSGGFILVPGLIVLIASIGVTLTLLAYWRDNARRARGALFLSLLCLTWGLLTSILLLAPELGGLAHLGPFYAVTLGIVALLTALGERPIESRLVSAGLVALAAGGATVAVTWDLIQADVLATARQVGPWLLVILALGLLPLVIRRGRPSGSSGASS
jgi:hypothetical protein